MRRISWRVFFYLARAPHSLIDLPFPTIHDLAPLLSLPKLSDLFIGEDVIGHPKALVFLTAHAGTV